MFLFFMNFEPLLGPRPLPPEEHNFHININYISEANIKVWIIQAIMYPESVLISHPIFILSSYFLKRGPGTYSNRFKKGQITKDDLKINPLS